MTQQLPVVEVRNVSKKYCRNLKRSLRYGLADLWGGVRLLRTAPISREMILNFVAQHSLGLPKSY